MATVLLITFIALGVLLKRFNAQMGVRKVWYLITVILIVNWFVHQAIGILNV